MTKQAKCDVFECQRDYAAGLLWTHPRWGSVYVCACSVHAGAHRNGEPCPPLKRRALFREQFREADGVLRQGWPDYDRRRRGAL